MIYKGAWFTDGVDDSTRHWRKVVFVEVIPNLVRLTREDTIKYGNSDPHIVNCLYERVDNDRYVFITPEGRYIVVRERKFIELNGGTAV